MSYATVLVVQLLKPTFSSDNNSLLLNAVWAGDPASVLPAVNGVHDWIKQQLYLGMSRVLNCSSVE